MSIQTLNTNAALIAQQNSLGTTLSASRFNPGATGSFMQSSSQLFNSLAPMLSQSAQFSPLGQSPAFQGFQGLTNLLGQFTQSLGQMLQAASQGGFGGQFLQGGNQGLGVPFNPGSVLPFINQGQGQGLPNLGGLLSPGGQGGFQPAPSLQPSLGPGALGQPLPQSLPNGTQDKSEITRNASRYFDALAAPNGMINKDSLEKALSHPHEAVRQTAQALLNDPELLKQMDTAHARARGNIGEKADGTISRGDMQAELGKTNFAAGDQQTISTLINNFDQLIGEKGRLDKKKLEAFATQPKNGNPKHDALVNAALDMMAKPELWSKLDNANLNANGDTRSKRMGDGNVILADLQAALKASISNTPLAGKTPGGAGAAVESLYAKVTGETGLQQAANKIPFVQR